MHTNKLLIWFLDTHEQSFNFRTLLTFTLKEICITSLTFKLNATHELLFYNCKFKTRHNQYSLPSPTRCHMRTEHPTSDTIVTMILQKLLFIGLSHHVTEYGRTVTSIRL